MPNKKPVLIEMRWKGSYYHFRMTGPKYSAYPEENEVLLFDGVKMIVESVEENWKVEYEGQFKD